MNFIGINPNHRFLAYAVMDEKNRVHAQGSADILFMTNQLDELIRIHEVQRIAVECYLFNAVKVINGYQFRTIEIIGRIEQYCLMQKISFVKYSRQEIAIAISGSSRNSDATIQRALMLRAGFRKVIKPENISSAAAAAFHAHNMYRLGE
jgi:Holliday junction resolvasome RuvABC endonuclease subunit